MKIININNKILIKNNYLYLKNKYYCFIKIPNFIKIKFINNFLFINSIYYNKSIEITFEKIIKNLLLGINNFWYIEILISGIGYKIYLEKNKIFLNLGFTKAKNFIIPNYINIELKKEKIILKSVFKDKLGEFSFKILKSKKFDPYKKKGIFIENKVILKKSSKKKQ
ncbi:50S ribosomal protein L6 [Candidatus Carsonella ruddii]|uniref:50S ribosomal protein L6 n=1 Tax=Candidatus Carsonella ruddii HC isolate Thao2000 TaxID=1202538 RepID=J3TW63_CARRU|nr:50S ribosomal protein L6 [Candidatus Carsonella ruddii]AFP84010.1 ribosomal protein L6 [Candidatus Carsonella ruddii HC isolate Thao2000]